MSANIYPGGNDQPLKNGTLRAIQLQNITTDTWKQDIDFYNSPCRKSCNDYEINQNILPVGLQGKDPKPRWLKYGGTNNNYCEGLVNQKREYCWLGPQNLKHTFGTNTGVATIPASYRNNFNADPSSIQTDAVTNIDKPVNIKSLKYNLPNPVGNDYIDPLIPKILTGYKKANQISDNDYQNYMKDYCFSDVKSKCPKNPKTGVQYSTCPRILQSGYNSNGDPASVCEDWRKIGDSSKTSYDSAVFAYANKPENVNIQYNKCLSASNSASEDNSTFNAFSNTPMGQYQDCWYAPCKNIGNTLRTSNLIDPHTCPNVGCVNIMDFKNLTQSTIDGIKQTCSSTQDGKTTTINNKADSITGDYRSTNSSAVEENTTTTNNNALIIIIGIVLFMIIIAVAYFMFLK